MTELAAQPCRIGDRAAHFRVRHLALCALVEEANLEALAGLALDITELWQLGARILGHAQEERSVAHAAAQRGVDQH